MKLIDHTVMQFVDELASRRATPGGGSAAAAAGAMAAGLCTMVARLTKESRARMDTVSAQGGGLQERFLHLVDADAGAYSRVVAAYRLPRENDEQKAGRAAAIQDAFREAADVPLETLQTAAELSELLPTVLEHGNRNCLSDAGAAVHLCRTCAHVAGYNVTINLDSIADGEYVEKSRRAVDELLKQVNGVVDKLEKEVATGLRPEMGS